MRRAPGPGRAGLLLLLAVLAGCSARSVLVPPLPPETTVFVQMQGAADTVNHVVRLYWSGSDPDGEVIAFELRFLNPAAPADSAWVRTTIRDSLFTVYSPAGYTVPVFEVRAIDDDGQRDPTPARQAFQFSNLEPVVRLLNRPLPTDSTFASLTLSWQISDPDGNPLLARYLVFLDSAGVRPTDLSAARVVTGDGYTIPTGDFGPFQDRLRTVYVMPVDDGGRIGQADSARWYVRAPFSAPGTAAQLLIVDDLVSSQGNNLMWDTLYANTASRNLPPGNFQVARLQFNPRMFRSVRDLEQTFALFDAVVWYRGEDASFSNTLRDYQDGIGTYVSSGGRLYLEGLDLVDGFDARGPLRPDFMTRYLGSDFLFKNHKPPVATDSSTSWGISNTRTVRSTILDDSLRMNTIYGGLRAFGVRDTNHVLLWARPGTLSQPHSFDAPIALSVPQTGGGRMLLSTLPIARANRTFVSNGSQNTARFVAKIYRNLGVIP